MGHLALQIAVSPLGTEKVPQLTVMGVSLGIGVCLSGCLYPKPSLHAPWVWHDGQGGDRFRSRWVPAPPPLLMLPPLCLPMPALHQLPAQGIGAYERFLIRVNLI